MSAAQQQRDVDVPPIDNSIPHLHLLMALSPVPPPTPVPPPPGFTVRKFRKEPAEAAEADRQAWAEVEVSAGEVRPATSHHPARWQACSPPPRPPSD